MINIIIDHSTSVFMMASDSSKGKTSLEDRITMPEHKDIPTIATSAIPEAPKAPKGMDATAASFTPVKSWADEVNSPADAKSAAVDEKSTAVDEKTSAADEKTVPADETSSAVDDLVSKTEGIDLAKAQVDGATESQNGSSQIYEPTYDVDVKLSDVQADPNNPLYSIKSFDELGL